MANTSTNSKTTGKRASTRTTGAGARTPRVKANPALRTVERIEQDIERTMTNLQKMQTQVGELRRHVTSEASTEREAA